MTEIVRPLGTAASERFEVDIDADAAGWEHCSLRVLRLEAGASTEIATGDSEWIAVPLSGAFDIEVDGGVHRLRGRAGVFAGPTDVLYLPLDSTARVTSPTGGRIAFPGSRAANRLPVQFLAAEDMPIAWRGAGNMSRRAYEFCNDRGITADRMIAMEVLTPSGNWSSYPPHKHDVDSDTETQLEEVYYFEVSEGPTGPGFGYVRARSADERPLDVLAEVHTGDVVLVPFGWHGPVVAPPGHDVYYLNVMAGGGENRVWKFSDDPDAVWIRETWDELEIDPRLR